MTTTAISEVTSAGSGVAPRRAYRLESIDMLRGLVIVIMALDHVRDHVMMNVPLDPVNDANVPPAIFFTRWITHYCAPVFVVLAGVSAGLMIRRKTPAELGRFLLTRGLWLIFVEFAIVSTAWTFSPGGISEFGGLTVITLQVIWAIGISMVALAGFQFLGRSACLWIGVAIIAGHNLLDTVWPAAQIMDQQWPLWVALHAQMSVPASPFLLVNIYPFPAWIGVILLGFGASSIFELLPERRNRLLLRMGLAMTAAFLVLRAVDAYGDPNHWQMQARGAAATVIDFLNTTKYPPSLLFLLMTLGPAAIVCALAERVPTAIRRTLVIFGRVPFAFYVTHLYLIHAVSVALGVAQGFHPGQMFTLFFFFPKGYGLSLAGVYVVWILVVAGLYPFCRWMAGVKAARRDWWLSYI